MNSLGERLREERERLGLSQVALAQAAGVGLRSQRNYEKGERAPDAPYLQGIAAAGADIQYVLTGITRDAHRRLDLLEHASEIAAMEHDDFVAIRALAKRLHALLQHYLRCSPADQARVGQLAELLAVQPGRPTGDG